MAKNFNISWTAPTNDGGSTITSYDVGYTPSGSSEIIVSTASNSASYTLSGLTDGVEYSVRVRAVNSIGPGLWSDAVTQLAAIIPYAPTNLSSTPGDGQLSLSWDAPSNNGGSSITEYIIRYTPADASSITVETNSTLTTYILSGLINATTYTIEVAAINIIGIGIYSTPISDSPIAPTTTTTTTEEPTTTTTTTTPAPTTTTPAPTGPTELLLNFDNNLTDDGPNSYTITGSSVLYDSTNKTFGSASMYGGSLSLTSTDTGAILDSMSGDFTIEFWACYDYLAPFLVFGIQANGGSYELGAGVNVILDSTSFYDWVELYDDTNFYDTLTVTYGGIVPITEYDYETSTVIPVLKHVAIVRSGTDISIYSDGSRVANFTGPLNIQAGGTNYFTVDAGASDVFWIDSLRISSAALYSGTSFTVPTNPLS